MNEKEIVIEVPKGKHILNFSRDIGLCSLQAFSDAYRRFLESADQRFIITFGLESVTVVKR